jgi:hypothetical protein
VGPLDSQQAPARQAAPAVAAAPLGHPPPQLIPIPIQVSWMHLKDGKLADLTDVWLLLWRNV